jgi:glycosyltransferase involved in cell wall biosynthesis
MLSVVVVDTTLAGPVIGGAQTFLADLAAGLVSREAHVSLVTTGALHDKIAAPIAQSGAEIYQDIWLTPSLVQDISPSFARWLNIRKPDAYVVSVSPDVGWTTLPYLRPEIATLAIAHNDGDVFYRPITHYASFLTCVIGVSQVVCDRLRSRCRIPPEQVVWIPYGVYPGKCPAERPAESVRDPLRIVYASRLEDLDKRASDVIEIVKRLRGILSDYRLDIAGDGTLQKRFRDLLAPEISEGRVVLHGWLTRVELHRILEGADAFLLTSDSEGFPIALVEAMAHGLAPVVTKLPSGTPDVVHHMENGILVQIGAIDDFVNAIQLLARDRHLLASIRHAAWRTGQSFTVVKMIDNYLDCFSAAMERARSFPRTPVPDYPLMETCRSRYPTWMRRLKISARRLAQKLA